MVSKGERRQRAAQRQAAVDAVAAYLVDDDAEVYNLTEQAVREDPLAMALNLTALAAKAVQALAAVTERSPDDVLRSLHRP